MTYVAYRTARGRMSIEMLIFLWTAIASVPAVFDISREACAIGLAAVIFVPLVLTWIRTRRLLVADPIIVLGAMWILAVTIPVLLPDLYKDRMWWELPPWSLDEAARWMYRAWAACCIAYWGGKLWFGERRGTPASTLDRRVQIYMRHWIGVLGVLGTLIYIVFMGGHTYQILEDAAVADSTTKQIIILVMGLSYAYIYLYFYARGTSKVDKIDTCLLYAVFAAQAIVFIGSGSKYAMFMIAAAYMLGNATSTSRPGFLKEIGVGVAGIAGVFATSYLVATYRGELVSRTLPATDAPVTEVVAFQLDVMTTAVSDVLQGKQVGEGYYTDYDSSFIFDRVGHLASFALFMDFNGWRSPYENAISTAVAPIFAVIPSALFPNKPRFIHSGDFAKMYGWTHGGISMTTPGSLFWAWSFTGIIVGMALLGLVIAWLSSWRIADNSTALILRVTMVMMVLSLMNLGVTFQMVVVPATRFLLLLLLLRWGISTWQKTRHLLK